MLHIANSVLQALDQITQNPAVNGALNDALDLEEPLEVVHLPHGHDEQHGRLKH